MLEQYYLDRFLLKYNIRRIALGASPASSTNDSKRIGKTNLHFGKIGEKGAAWGQRHSPL